MMTLAEEIESVCRDSSIFLVRLSGEVCARIRRELARAYGDPDGSWPLWDRVPRTGVSSLHAPDAWSLIGKYVGDRGCYLLFNPQDEETIFELRSGSDLDRLLSDSYAYEFYVTDPTLKYLICFNHHDYLIGFGDAQAWVDELEVSKSRS